MDGIITPDRIMLFILAFGAAVSVLWAAAFCWVTWEERQEMKKWKQVAEARQAFEAELARLEESIRKGGPA